jgi:putative PIN family toxin of toxin-antitoxin system
MRVIVDTNVLVSAVLRGRLPRAVVQFIINDPNCDWIVSSDILAEYQEVLTRPKFKLTQEVIEEWWETFETVPRLIQVNIDVDFPRDKKDAKFLACAMVAGADFLITGDRDFTDAEILGNTKVISVSLFKSLIVDANQ